MHMHICINANIPPVFNKDLYVNPSTLCFFAKLRVIRSQVAPWGSKFPPRLIPNRNAIKIIFGTSPGKMFRRMIINNTAVGLLAKNPEKRLDIRRTPRETT